MNDQTQKDLTIHAPATAPLDGSKFQDPDVTASGEPRATVPLDRLKTLWINTGTICNVECNNCYIESSPSNDRLTWFRNKDLASLLDEAEQLALPLEEVGFTGGEPFINPQTPFMIVEALSRGLRVLVLTNAMRPMMLPKMQDQLLKIAAHFGDSLTLRISLDHYTETLHDAERGAGSFAVAMKGISWLIDNGFSIDIAGRTCFGESEADVRQGFARLFESHGIDINAHDPAHLMLFPEMDDSVDVPEITNECWDILGKAPSDVMCASSRMAVLRKGEQSPKILPCTLLAYDTNFEMGTNLSKSLRADSSHFDKGAVKLNHPHCARFCVLGGGTCTA